MQILDGRATAELVKTEIAAAVAEIKARGGKVPHLAAVIVGDDGASHTYVNNKVRTCKELGFDSSLISLPTNTSEAELLQTVAGLNENDDIDGFIVQVPLPAHINEDKVTEAIDPEKDVDGFHPENLGRMMLGLPSYISATPNGILELLKRNNIKTAGKHCVVVGRSNIVGTPMSVLMSRNTEPGNCTVTLVHSRTSNMQEICASADILIVAIGKPEFIKADMVKEGAVVIDVGTTRVPDASKEKGFSLKGDVDFDAVKDKCSFITPVPGGVGPMTIVSLMQNTLLARSRKMRQC
jgi:methylenetetrahydrofolate dehydrogenase (NADP+)/methenyltetrahydrofolate cyclohydrolase